MEHHRLFAAAALACLILLASCAGKGVQPGPEEASPAGQGSLDADYLRGRSGTVIDGIGFHLLDREMQVLPDWQGIELHGSLQRGFTLDCGTASPDDIFLAITYDDDSLQLSGAELTPAAATGNLMLAINRRIDDVMLLGITRTSGHGTPRESMQLARISFLPGSERTWRSTSLVNEDPASSVELEAEVQDMDVTLRWEERNIGDYDNNGLVSIADITPIGLLFQQTLSSHDPPEEVVLVDGDGNGEVNLADLTPIARNFNRGISGYSLYMADFPGADSSQLSPIQQPAVLRMDVYAQASQQERRQRLTYSYRWSAPSAGQYSLAVRPWSNDGTEGLFSNVASVEAVYDNLPPVFQGNFFGLTQVTGVQLYIPEALDPEGEAVSYELSYSATDSPDSVQVTLDEDDTSGDPPYEYFAAGLERGKQYIFTLRARDASGLANNGLAESLVMPTFDPDIAQRWDNIGADQARTSSMPASGLREPLVLDASVALEAGDELRRNEAVIDDADNVLFAKGQVKHHFRFADGENLDLERGSYGSGPFLPSLARTYNSMYMLATDGQSAWRSRLPDLVYELGVPNSGHPLMMGELMFIGLPDGSIHLQNYFEGETLLSDPTGSASLSICSDGDNIYQLCEDGSLQRFSMPFFGDALTADLPAPQSGNSLVYLESIDALAVALPDGNFTVRSASDLSEIHTSDAADGTADTCLAAVQWTDPPMLLVGESDSGNGRLRAVSMDDWSVLWDEAIQVESISASVDRIFIRNQAGLQLLDFQGRLRQDIPLSGNVNSQPVLDAQGLAAVNGAQLSWFRESPADQPPVWQGNTGLRELETGDGQVSLRWDSAVDEHGEPVHYVVIYGDDFPPDPGSVTAQFVTDIPDEGTATHEYVLDGLANGTRYWFIVRAYDGWWDDNPNLEENFNWLAATPPWKSEELLLGGDLPDGEIFFMRGIADPSGTLHLVYNDEQSIELTHVFGTTGSWQHETDGLSGWPSNAFDLAWDTDLVLGRANSLATQLGLLERNGLDSYSETAVSGSVPLTNPQLAVAIGTEMGLAWTEYASGTLPQVVGHYYYSNTSSGNFLPPVAVEEPLENYGRDLDLLFDPADNTSPWLAFQRGPAQTDNRLTPVDGTLHFWRDLGSGITVEDVDLGDNPGESDVGKRVQMVLDSSGNPLLAYYDLDSDPLQPRGQLKTARWDGSQWVINVLENRDLSFQDQFTYRHTAPELDIATDGSGTIAIGELLRANMPASGDQPHSVGVRAWIDSGSGFELEVLTEALWMLPSDREPCVAMYDNADILHIFVATAQEPPKGEDYVADTILHLWRGD